MNRAQRRFKTFVSAKKQQLIARQHGQAIPELGRFKKQNAMDCGNPRCFLDGNPRKNGSKDRLTVQELRFAEKARTELSGGRVVSTQDDIAAEGVYA